MILHRLIFSKSSFFFPTLFSPLSFSANIGKSMFMHAQKSAKIKQDKKIDKIGLFVLFRGLNLASLDTLKGHSKIVVSWKFPPSSCSSSLLIARRLGHRVPVGFRVGYRRLFSLVVVAFHRFWHLENQLSDHFIQLLLRSV